MNSTSKGTISGATTVNIIQLNVFRIAATGQGASK